MTRNPATPTTRQISDRISHHAARGHHITITHSHRATNWNLHAQRPGGDVYSAVGIQSEELLEAIDQAAEVVARKEVPA